MKPLSDGGVVISSIFDLLISFAKYHSIENESLFDDATAIQQRHSSYHPACPVLGFHTEIGEISQANKNYFSYSVNSFKYNRKTSVERN